MRRLWLLSAGCTLASLTLPLSGAEPTDPKAPAKLLAIAAAAPAAAAPAPVADAPATSAPEAATSGLSSSKSRPTTASTVLVEAVAAPLSPTTLRITADAINTAAGAHEDPARFFQLLPGVVSDSDARNDFIVRGGNPSENLFVIDNIDVHSISHLALSSTTGGFVSMIDNAAVQSMTLHTADHDAKFDDRLSSVVEITTIPDHGPGGRLAVRHMTEAGIAGVGGLDSRPIGDSGSLFISGREGILRLFTNDIGINGVPSYTNNLVRGDNTFANGDKIWGLSLTGLDSITLHPDPTDVEETNPIDVHYSGWRNSTGINYQRVLSNSSFGVFTLSNSEQAQTVVENDQTQNNLDIYNEKTHDGTSSFKSQFTFEAHPRLVLSAGTTETLDRVNYNIVQPDGATSNPYDANPFAASATNIHRDFTTHNDAGYLQTVATLPGNIRLTLAERAHHWAFGSHLALTPKAALSFPLGGTRSFTVGIADYTQLPAFLYLLSFAQNQGLEPIRARHLTASVTLVNHSRVRLALAGYRKTYRDYPVSTQFPQLSLANVSDTFGQAFLMFPMVSRGTGVAMGGEFSFDLRPSSRMVLAGNLAYSRNQYSGLDGVLRNGSFDIPVVANIATVVRLGRGVITSFRYSATSGKPYTPDDLPLSYAQNRDVYDNTQINALRSHAYGRLDFRVERAQSFHNGTLLWHVGLDNALNQRNFYAYQWQTQKGGPAEQRQMPIFPDGGVKFTF